MARRAEAAMHRRRIARIALVVICAVPLALVMIVMICAGASTERNR